MVGNNILVTGGAGYIGSHTVLQLLLCGYNTVVIDNLDMSSLNRVKDLAGYHGQYLIFRQVDLLNRPALEKVFSESKFDAVIHFAGQKAVGECVAHNLIRTITLLDVMAAHGCKKLVVSSSATPKELPCTEESPLSEPIPFFTEDICRDFHRGDPEWRIIMLMYFNPVAAHPSGRIGEDPYHKLIMPYLKQVVSLRLHNPKICGADYTTKDGTGVRDYLQVVDLADGHICALQKLDDTEIGFEVYNLGTGKGTTVLEMVDASEKASGMKIPQVSVGKRPGDPADGVSEKIEGPLHELSAYLLKHKAEVERLALGCIFLPSTGPLHELSAYLLKHKAEVERLALGCIFLPSTGPLHELSAYLLKHKAEVERLALGCIENERLEKVGSTSKSLSASAPPPPAPSKSQQSYASIIKKSAPPPPPSKSEASTTTTTTSQDNIQKAAD